MASLAMSLGNLGQDVGEAFKQQRAFDMQKAAMESNIALNAQKIAESQAQVNALGRYQPIINQPILNKEGKWVIPMRDVRHPEAGITYIEAGAPAGSIAGIFQQLGAAGITPELVQSNPDLAQRLILGALFKGATGSASTAILGQHATTSADAQGNPVAAVQDVLNNTVKPSGGAANKPIPTVPTVVEDSAGNQQIVNYPRYTGAGANKGAAAKPAVPAQPSATPTTSPVPAPPQPSSGGGLVKSYAKLSTDGANTLEGFKAAEPMLGGLVQSIVSANMQNAGRGGYADALAQKAQTLKYWTLYQNGAPVPEFYRQNFALADLYRNAMTGGYLHGIRRGDLIQAIQNHMPRATDTPAQMYDKAVALQALNPQIEKAILNFEKERAKGVTRMDITTTAQVPAQLQQYVGMRGVREVQLSDGTVWHVGDGQATQVKGK